MSKVALMDSIQPGGALRCARMRAESCNQSSALGAAVTGSGDAALIALPPMVCRRVVRPCILVCM